MSDSSYNSIPGDRFAGMGSSRVSGGGEDGGLTPGLKKGLIVGVAVLVALFVVYGLVSGVGGRAAAAAPVSDRSESSEGAKLESIRNVLGRCEKELKKYQDSPPPSSSSSSSSSEFSQELEKLRRERNVLVSKVKDLEEQLVSSQAATKQKTASSSDSSECSVKLKVMQTDNENLKAAAERLAKEAADLKAEASKTAGNEKVTTTAASDKPAGDLEACLKRTQVLGEEVRLLTLKLQNVSATKKGLEQLSETLRSEEKLLDKDTLKVMNASDHIKENKEVVSALKDVRNDMIRRSVEISKAADNLAAAKSAVSKSLDQARDVAVKIEKDVAAPLESVQQEQKKLDVVKSKVAVAENAAPSGASLAKAASSEAGAVAVPALAQEQSDLLSRDKVVAVKAAEKLIDAAAKLSNAQEEIADATRAVVEKEEAVKMQNRLAKAQLKVQEAKLDSKLKKVEKEEKVLAETRKEVVAKINGGMEEVKSQVGVGGDPAGPAGEVKVDVATTLPAVVVADRAGEAIESNTVDAQKSLLRLEALKRAAAKRDETNDSKQKALNDAVNAVKNESN